MKTYEAPKVNVRGSLQSLTKGAGWHSLDDLWAGNFSDPLGTPPRTGS